MSKRIIAAGQELEPIVEKELDVSRTIEATLLGAFLLGGRMGLTWWDFLVHPSHLVFPCNDYERETGTRPITFFVLSSAITLGMFELLFRIQRKHGHLPDANLFERLLVEGFAKGEVWKIVLATVPFLVAVGLYSYGIQRAAKARKLSLSFEQSLAYSCFCAGSILLLYAALVPLTQMLPLGSSQIPFWSYPISAIGWGLQFWFLRSYLILLKTSLGLKWSKVLRLWMGGLGRFLLWYFVLIFWFLPLALNLIEK